MSELAQYFTLEPFSRLLANNIYFENPKIILDLGIGNGSLTSAAQERWKDATFYGVDVDMEKVNLLYEKLGNVTLYNFDSLDSDLHRKINLKVGTVDIAICNPPYLNIKRSENFNALLLSVCLNRCIELRSYTTDLLFFAQNLALLKQGGILGIILPAGLICGHEYEGFRRDLLENHSIETVIELESRIFKKTDAKTFIVIVKKGRGPAKKVLLATADEKGLICGNKLVLKKELDERMDYSFHKNKSEFVKSGYKLKDLATRIQRGNYTNLQLRALRVPYFHTTDFKNYAEAAQMAANDYGHLPIAPAVAVEGDIIIGRVGKTCHKQVVIIKCGQIAISDCVYKITVPKKYRLKVLRFLRSPQGTNNLRFLKHGVCAQVISKRNLEDLILDLESTKKNQRTI